MGEDFTEPAIENHLRSFRREAKERIEKVKQGISFTVDVDRSVVAAVHRAKPSRAAKGKDTDKDKVLEGRVTKGTKKTAAKAGKGKEAAGVNVGIDVSCTLKHE